MLDVLADLGPGQTGEATSARDALAQLAQVRAREILLELRLSDQHDSQQLRAIGLEVGEEAHLLEHRGIEILRPVDDQEDAAAPRRSSLDEN